MKVISEKRWQSPLQHPKIYKISQTLTRFLQSLGISQRYLHAPAPQARWGTPPACSTAGCHLRQIHRARKNTSNTQSKVTGPRLITNSAIADRLLKASPRPVVAAFLNSVARLCAGGVTSSLRENSTCAKITRCSETTRSASSRAISAFTFESCC